MWEISLNARWTARPAWRGVDLGDSRTCQTTMHRVCLSCLHIETYDQIDLQPSTFAANCFSMVARRSKQILSHRHVRAGVCRYVRGEVRGRCVKNRSTWANCERLCFALLDEQKQWHKRGLEKGKGANFFEALFSAKHRKILSPRTDRWNVCLPQHVCTYLRLVKKS